MKKILANSAIFTLILALVVSLSMTSCTPKTSDKAVKDEVDKTLADYNKAIGDLDAAIKAMNAPFAPDAAAQLTAKMKPIMDAQKKWADNYDKVWKIKLIEADVQAVEKNKADLDKKAGDLKAAADKKNDEIKNAAPAPADAAAPAPAEPVKK